MKSQRKRKVGMDEGMKIMHNHQQKDGQSEYLNVKRLKTLAEVDEDEEKSSIQDNLSSYLNRD
jgi:hypothetical protein